ncbi:MAG: leucyl/phenylalanyl-tRNA--protein transferase [Desulfobacterales bacterium]|nr:leucyl/phenylalanyl-tRNA--protein transferase [Desulfobacterales bacterium]
MPVYQLIDDIMFPPADYARPDGLLAVGGDLSEERLLLAYRMGIFPWYLEDEPVLWWSPDPRLILYPDKIKISKSLNKVMEKNIFNITIDQAFEDVMRGCATIKTKKRDVTWIVKEMIPAYCNLHRSGYAHSVEVWKDDKLVGGLYGLSLGKCFFGESMFSMVSNASKVALAKLANHLEKNEFDMIDCQVTSSHLISMGAQEISRKEFLEKMGKSLCKPDIIGKWKF